MLSLAFPSSRPRLLRPPAPALAAVAILALTGHSLRAAERAPFHFVAIGDTAYRMPAEAPVYTELIERINREKPAFTIHVGDTKGDGDCGEKFQRGVLGWFSRYDHPLIYALGNNEWSDCWQSENGSGDPLATLAVIRRTFFSTDRSLGKRTLRLHRQSDAAGFKEFRENALWTHGGVVFATLNIVGTANNMESHDERSLLEFFRRNQANAAWIGHAFDEAKRAEARGVVLAFHSDPFAREVSFPGGPFEATVQAIEKGAGAFPGQVLVVHGHGHEFKVDRPLLEMDDDAGTVRYANVTRLEVHGWPELKAVKVTVDPEAPWVFGFQPLHTANWIGPN